MTERDLENIYRENLEESIIFAVSERRKIPYEEAIDIYYRSSLAKSIYEGKYCIQYLDYKILTDILEDEL